MTERRQPATVAVRRVAGILRQVEPQGFRHPEGEARKAGQLERVFRTALTCRKVLSIDRLVASVQDVVEDRRAAKAVVEQVNRVDMANAEVVILLQLALDVVGGALGTRTIVGPAVEQAIDLDPEYDRESAAVDDLARLRRGSGDPKPVDTRLSRTRSLDLPIDHVHVVAAQFLRKAAQLLDRGAQRLVVDGVHDDEFHAAVEGAAEPVDVHLLMREGVPPRPSRKVAVAARVSAKVAVQQSLAGEHARIIRSAVPTV